MIKGAVNSLYTIQSSLFGYSISPSCRLDAYSSSHLAVLHSALRYVFTKHASPHAATSRASAPHASSRAHRMAVPSLCVLASSSAQALCSQPDAMSLGRPTDTALQHSSPLEHRTIHFISPLKTLLSQTRSAHAVQHHLVPLYHARLLRLPPAQLPESRNSFQLFAWPWVLEYDHVHVQILRLVYSM